MGNAESRQKAPLDSYRAETQASYSANDSCFSSQVKEFPRAHGTGSVTSVDCVMGTSVCMSGGSEGRISLFDVAAQKLLMRWKAHEKELTKVIHTDIEQMIISASRDKLIKVWKGHSDTPAHVLTGHTLGVSSITSNKDGSSILSGSRDNSVRLWDTRTGHCISQVSQPRNVVTAVKWIQGTSQVVQTGEDKVMKIWDTRSLQVVKTFPVKQYFQTSCDVSACGGYIVTGSTGFNGNGCDVTTWDVREAKVQTEFKGHTQKVSECRYMTSTSNHAPGSLLISVSLDCTIKIWSLSSEACLLSEAVPGAKELKTVSSFQDGRFVVGTHDYGIHYCKLVEGHGGWHINPILRF